MSYRDRKTTGDPHQDHAARVDDNSSAPGKRTLTMSLPPRPASAPATMQARHDPAAKAPHEAHAALTARWMDVAMRPDLHALPVQRRSAGEERGPASALRSGGSGQPMPEDVQAGMERAFGAEFSAVRIHQGPEAAAVGALAYTQGTDIHFAPGRYDPGSRSGQELLGHELTHVVQQAQGRVPATAQSKGVAINDDSALEREADELGARAARGERASGPERPPVRIRGSGQPEGAMQLLMNKQAFLRKSATRIHDGNINMNPIHTMRDALRNEIGDELDAYSGLTVPLEQMAALDSIEHKTYQLIDKVTDPGVKEGGLVLLDELQAEHQAVIRPATGWVTKVFSADPTDQDETDVIWGRIMANDKIIVANQTYPFKRNEVRSFPEFPAEILSAFARLISRSAGRKLVGKILDHPKQVGIYPLDDVTAQYAQDKTGLTAPVDPDSQDSSVAARLAQQNLDAQDGKLSTFVQDSKPVGSDAFIFLPPGAKDSDTYAFDQEGRRIHSPMFLKLGHELIHAKAMMRGRKRGKNQARGGIWGNLEEFRAIEGGKTSENTLRREHRHLSQRHGHHGGVRHQSAWKTFVQQVSPVVVMLAVGIYSIYLQQQLENP